MNFQSTHILVRWKELADKNFLNNLSRVIQKNMPFLMPNSKFPFINDMPVAYRYGRIPYSSPLQQPMFKLNSLFLRRS